MPEGPELRISKELISPLVIGKYIRRIEIGHKSRYASVPPDGLKDFVNSFTEKDIVNFVNQLKIIDVNVKGKFMYWTFDNGWYMFSTFGMTGQWSPIAGKHVCLEMKLYDDAGNNSSVFFNDPRHFGTIKFVNNKKDLDEKLSELGWDPFTPFKDRKSYILSALKKSNKSICDDLMNQKIFSGVGNYIRAEALYLSKLSPWAKSFLLSEDEIENLCASIVKVMEDSYSHQGATISTYKDAYGAEGKYTTFFRVYGKKVDSNGYKVVKEQSGDGRTIHWCPEVQLFSK